MKYKGLYLNLDRSPERRQQIEAELARNNLAGYVRFPATCGNALNFPNLGLKQGEMGCFTSYFRLLDEHRASTDPLHIIEDDILLSLQTGPVLEWAIDSGNLAKYDIVYTDVSVPLLNDACQAYKNFYDATVRRDESGKIDSVTFSVIDMRELIFASMCSFLVNPRSIGKLASLFEQALKTGAPQPIDIYIRTLCQKGEINVGCIFPFVTSIHIGSSLVSTIEKPCDESPALAANILRHSFFIGSDWNQCLDLAARHFPQPDPADTHRQIMQRLLGYSLTTDYKKC
ncbi:MAG: hypothetical protein P4M13_02105 [Alphaproteobacteria bacterium]|nr:hypothetical protein [Alphaproteobacteria bacterium]